jgi:hypothetical protein
MDTINIQDLNLPNRDTAPFVYDIGARVLKGALAGYVVGFVFFRGRRSRRFLTYYGAGFGLGMSYS